jgi:hypothetical protein
LISLAHGLWAFLADHLIFIYYNNQPPAVTQQALAGGCNRRSHHLRKATTQTSAMPAHVSLRTSIPEEMNVPGKQRKLQKQALLRIFFCFCCLLWVVERFNKKT